MLTDDMTRLCAEIVAMRKMRGNLMSEIQHDSKGRKKAVAKFCAHLGSARAAMARRSKHERVAFHEPPEALGWRRAPGDERRLGRRPQRLGRHERIATFDGSRSKAGGGSRGPRPAVGLGRGKRRVR